jgi:hypothetical protein
VTNSSKPPFQPIMSPPWRAGLQFLRPPHRLPSCGSAVWSLHRALHGQRMQPSQTRAAVGLRIGPITRAAAPKPRPFSCHRREWSASYVRCVFSCVHLCSNRAKIPAGEASPCRRIDKTCPEGIRSVSSQDHRGGIRSLRARVSLIETGHARRMQNWALENSKPRLQSFGGARASVTLARYVLRCGRW